jgi:hypothetical protein
MDGTVRVWSTETWECVQTVEAYPAGSSQYIRHLALCGPTLVGGSYSLSPEEAVVGGEGRGEVRVAYDYRSQYTSSFNATQPWNNDGWANYGQWDLTARYRVTSRWHADFSIRNLGNAHRVHLRGLDLAKLHEDVDFGSSFWLGVTYRH